MPYIVPSPAASASTSNGASPHSPIRPPLALSIALASPAPVPPHTPFTPPELPTPLRTGSTPECNTQSLFSAAKKIGGRGHSVLSLVKASSDTAAASPSKASSSKMNYAPRSPSIRRAVSTSDASPPRNVYQHSNAAASSLPHVPRRRAGSATSLLEQSPVPAPTSPSTPPRGRVRSRFVLGSEEENESGSSGEHRKGRENGYDDGGKEAIQHMEERVTRKRHVSAERKVTKATSSGLSRRTTDPPGDDDESESDSEGSDCATPTQSRMAKGRRRSCDKTAPSTESNKVHSREARMKDGAKVFAFGSVDEGGERNDETSTIEFPLSKSPSPPPFVDLDTPTPQATPLSSPLTSGSPPKSFAGKRASAGSLRLDFSFGSLPKESDGTLGERNRPAEHGRSLSESVSLSNMPLIRKKSGEVVRSALRSRSSSVNSSHRTSYSLGDIASVAAGTPSVSAPTTPSATPKMVHFGAQLEHVKFFKSTSRPTAVSRDGSPTFDDTTSGGEGDSASEGPSLSDIVPRRRRRLVPGGTTSEEEDALRRVLMMRVLNMPHRDMETDDADVRLECLHLADDAASVHGIVRVRNIAFEKSVVVRFTFDGWQTTSEVLGRWTESCTPRTASPLATPRARAFSAPVSSFKTDEIPAPTFDRFAFTIRLNDLLLRIDGKTLVLAVRYRSAGREMWDNNDGRNYHAVFERRPQHSLTLTGSAVIPSNPDATKDKNKAGDSGRKPSAVGGTHSNPFGSDSVRASPTKTTTFNALDKAVSGLKDNLPLSPSKKGSDLASRYDLDSSLRNPSSWQPSSEHMHTTWAGRDKAWARTPIPFSKEAPEPRESSIQTRLFESHRLSFNARAMAHGSPRDLDRDMLDDSEVEWHSKKLFAVADETCSPEGTPLRRLQGGLNRFVSPPSSLAFSGPASEQHGHPPQHVRNHHRSYFDAWVANGFSTSPFGTGKVRLTPPGTPLPLDHPSLSSSEEEVSSMLGGALPETENAEESREPFPGRTYSFPRLMPNGNGSATAAAAAAAAAAGLGLLTGHSLRGHGERNRPDSEASTPAFTNVSSPTATESPCSPHDYPVLTPAAAHTDSNASSASVSMMDCQGYNTLVDSLCFYRGFDGQLEDGTGGNIRRTHSESEVQELLSTPPPSSSEAFRLLKDPAPPLSSGTFNMSPGSLSPGAMQPQPQPQPQPRPPPPPTSAGLLETESGVSTRVRC